MLLLCSVQEPEEVARLLAECDEEGMPEFFHPPASPEYQARPQMSIYRFCIAVLSSLQCCDGPCEPGPAKPAPQQLVQKPSQNTQIGALARATYAVANAHALPTLGCARVLELKVSPVPRTHALTSRVQEELVLPSTLSLGSGPGQGRAVRVRIRGAAAAAHADGDRALPASALRRRRAAVLLWHARARECRAAPVAPALAGRGRPSWQQGDGKRCERQRGWGDPRRSRGAGR